MYLDQDKFWLIGVGNFIDNMVVKWYLERAFFWLLLDAHVHTFGD